MNLFFADQMNVLYGQKFPCVAAAVENKNKLPLHESIFCRSNECSIPTKVSMRSSCSRKQQRLLQRNNKSIKRKTDLLKISLKPKTPISLTSPEKINPKLGLLNVVFSGVSN